MRSVVHVLALLVAFACGGAASGPADITGIVTSLSGRPDGVTVLVESDPSTPTSGTKASVAVTSATRITRRAQSGGDVAATYRDLVPGMRVEVWFDGPVATSYPVQGKALALVIVR
jgi:hypothetical protein